MNETCQKSSESMRVRVARILFESSRFATIYGLKFDGVRAHLDRNETFTHIGKRFGIARNEVSEMYRTCFKDIYGGKDYRQRNEERIFARQKAAMESLEDTLPADANIRYIAERARAAGCKVEVLPRSDCTKIRAAITTVGVNGHICSVQSTQSVKYPRLFINRKTAKTVEAHVLIYPDCSNPAEYRIYILPAFIVYRLRFENNDRKWTTIIGPGNGRPPCGYTDLCLLGYENAWWVVGQLK